jgi:hypothetical protein
MFRFQKAAIKNAAKSRNLISAPLGKNEIQFPPSKCQRAILNGWNKLEKNVLNDLGIRNLARIEL